MAVGEAEREVALPPLPLEGMFGTGGCSGGKANGRSSLLWRELSTTGRGKSQHVLGASFHM